MFGRDASCYVLRCCGKVSVIGTHAAAETAHIRVVHANPGCKFDMSEKRKNPSEIREGVDYHCVTDQCNNVLTCGEHIGHKFGYVASCYLQYCLEQVRSRDPEIPEHFRQYLVAIHRKRLQCLYAGIHATSIPQLHQHRMLNAMMAVAEDVAKEDKLDLEHFNLVVGSTAEKAGALQTVLPVCDRVRFDLETGSAADVPRHAGPHSKHVGLSAFAKESRRPKKVNAFVGRRIGRAKDNAIFDDIPPDELDRLYVLSDLSQQSKNLSQVQEVVERDLGRSSLDSLRKKLADSYASIEQRDSGVHESIIEASRKTKGLYESDLEAGTLEGRSDAETNWNPSKPCPGELVYTEAQRDSFARDMDNCCDITVHASSNQELSLALTDCNWKGPVEVRNEKELALVLSWNKDHERQQRSPIWYHISPHFGSDNASNLIISTRRTGQVDKQHSQKYAGNAAIRAVVNKDAGNIVRGKNPYARKSTSKSTGEVSSLSPGPFCQISASNSTREVSTSSPLPYNEIIYRDLNNECQRVSYINPQHGANLAKKIEEKLRHIGTPRGRQVETIGSKYFARQLLNMHKQFESEGYKPCVKRNQKMLLGLLDAAEKDNILLDRLLNQNDSLVRACWTEVLEAYVSDDAKRLRSLLRELQYHFSMQMECDEKNGSNKRKNTTFNDSPRETQGAP